MLQNSPKWEDNWGLDTDYLFPYSQKAQPEVPYSEPMCLQVTWTRPRLTQMQTHQDSKYNLKIDPKTCPFL